MNLACTVVALALTAGPTLEDGALSVDARALFQLGSDALADGSKEVLDGVQRFLAEHPEVTKLRVEVHTDNLDLGNANQELSEKRAAALVTALVARGVDCGRLVAVGFGGSRPVASNETAKGRAENRRARFVRAEVKGQPQAPVDGGGKLVTACKER